MSKFSKFGLEILLVGTFAAGAPLSASADCSSDIDKVESAIVKAKEMDIAETTAEQMRELLDKANEEKRKGDEQKCQELIDQAKDIGNVE